MVTVVYIDCGYFVGHIHAFIVVHGISNLSKKVFSARTNMRIAIALCDTNC